MERFQISNSKSTTPKVVKILILTTLFLSCASAFLNPLLLSFNLPTLKYLFAFSLKKWITGFIWQPLTFLFLPHIEGPLNFYFLFNLSFDLYLIWFAGCKVHALYGNKTTLKIFFIPSFAAVLIASITNYYFFGAKQLFGPSYALISLFSAYCYNNPQGLLHYMLHSLHMRWICLGLVLLYLFQDLSNLEFTAFSAHLLTALFSYVYLLCFHQLKSPFSFTHRFDQFIISKLNKSHSSKVVPLYDQYFVDESGVNHTEKTPVTKKLKLALIWCLSLFSKSKN